MPNKFSIGVRSCLTRVLVCVAWSPLVSFSLITSFYASVAHAGGFDSSGQTIQALFGEGNELTLKHQMVVPQLSLEAERKNASPSNSVVFDVSDMVDRYHEPAMTLRLRISEAVSCLFKADQPFRFATEYKDDTLAYQDKRGDEVYAPYKSRYDSLALESFCRYQFDFDHRHPLYQRSAFSWIAGLRVQEISGEFSSDLTSMAVGAADNYRVTLNGSTGLGGSLGFAYEIPEIAFRWSLVYHSEIRHDLDGKASAPMGGGTFSSKAKGDTLTPQSVNMRLQTGISESWLAYISLRWGDWSKTDRIEVAAGPLSQTISLFESDTLNYQLGLGVKVSERLSLGGYVASLVDLDRISAPSGVDGTNIRNPSGSRYSLAFGGRYRLNQRFSIGLGASYFHLKQGRFADNSYTVNLARSKAYAIASSLSIRF